MKVLQEITDWGEDRLSNNIYFVKNNNKLHAYIKEGTDKIIKFSRPLSFSKSRRKFKELKLENYEAQLWVWMTTLWV